MLGYGLRILCLLSGLSVGVGVFTNAQPARADGVSVVETLAGGANAYYAGNREPLSASPLMKLPVGAIRPAGWLRTQNQLLADGMVGHLTEISPWCKFEGNAWTDPKGVGHSHWEELPYWLKGFISLGYVLRDERITNEAKRWVDACLASQREDGYFGPQANLDHHDLWPNMCMLFALRTYHEATGDERILPFMTRYFKWMSTVPFEFFLNGAYQPWQQWRAGDNLDSIYWLYNRTGESWLLDLARANHECTSPWTQTMVSWHGVNIAECFREPAQYFVQSKDIRHLRATERNYRAVIDAYGQVPGGLYGSDENCREGYIGPRQGTETCTMVEMTLSDQILTRITGQTIWADRCEEVAYNSLPAAMTPDLKALHYLTAPNQIQLDRANKSPMIQNPGDMMSYTPYEQYRCCQHNVAMGWPYLAENLWMATAGHGLAAVVYAPCEVTAKVGEAGVVRIEESTDYPFGDTVTLKLAVEKPARFPLALRIPAWCADPSVQVSGQIVDTSKAAGQWVVIDRTWTGSSTVILRLPMAVRTVVWHKNNNAVSVYRGPLAYSLKIGERWQNYSEPGKWAAYEVFPTTPWNYGLIVDMQNPARSFEFVQKATSISGQPFTPENAPAELKAQGKRIPQWKQEENGLVGLLQDSPVRSEEPTEPVTLIPMGCARLRISAFPQIGEGEQAKIWK